MKSQHEKAEVFRSMHQKGRSFIIPNPWDRGSARLLEHMGFEALATTGAGFAFSLGLPDQKVGFDQMMVYLKEICSATNLPVSADLQNGFSDAPELVAKTILASAEAGVVGGSIEDATGDAADPIYSLDLAVARIQAAADAAKSLPFPYTLTARAENYLYGRPDLDDTILRLRAYQEAGADVLYAPGISSREEIKSILGAIDRPLNVLMGFQGVQLEMRELTEMGVCRVSVGASLARAAYGALLRAGREMLESGTFGYAADAISGPEINGIFGKLT